jgi:hypothetical protein
MKRSRDEEIIWRGLQSLWFGEFMVCRLYGLEMRWRRIVARMKQIFSQGKDWREMGHSGDCMGRHR